MNPAFHPGSHARPAQGPGDALTERELVGKRAPDLVVARQHIEENHLAPAIFVHHQQRGAIAATGQSIRPFQGNVLQGQDAAERRQPGDKRARLLAQTLPLIRFDGRLTPRHPRQSAGIGHAKNIGQDTRRAGAHAAVENPGGKIGKDNAPLAHKLANGPHHPIGNAQSQRQHQHPELVPNQETVFHQFLGNNIVVQPDILEQGGKCFPVVHIDIPVVARVHVIPLGRFGQGRNDRGRIGRRKAVDAHMELCIHRQRRDERGGVDAARRIKHGDAVVPALGVEQHPGDPGLQFADAFQRLLVPVQRAEVGGEHAPVEIRFPAPDIVVQRIQVVEHRPPGIQFHGVVWVVVVDAVTAAVDRVPASFGARRTIDVVFDRVRVVADRVKGLGQSPKVPPGVVGRIEDQVLKGQRRSGVDSSGLIAQSADEIDNHIFPGKLLVNPAAEAAVVGPTGGQGQRDRVALLDRPDLREIAVVGPPRLIEGVEGAVALFRPHRQMRDGLRRPVFRKPRVIPQHVMVERVSGPPFRRFLHFPDRPVQQRGGRSEPAQDVARPPPPPHVVVSQVFMVTSGDVHPVLGMLPDDLPRLRVEIGTTPHQHDQIVSRKSGVPDDKRFAGFADNVAKRIGQQNVDVIVQVQ